MKLFDEQGVEEAPPKIIRNEVRADVSEDELEDVHDKDSSKLAHYAFHVSRDVVLGLQRGLRNIVPHYFNDHSGAQHLPLIDRFFDDTKCNIMLLLLIFAMYVQHVEHGAWLKRTHTTGLEISQEDATCPIMTAWFMWTRKTTSLLRHLSRTKFRPFSTSTHPTPSVKKLSSNSTATATSLDTV